MQAMRRILIWNPLLVMLVMTSAKKSRPHFIFIVADDMGWRDASFHGSSEIMTPNIDALVYSDQGVILNRHYTQPSCSPSRAALLTGRYPAKTGVHMPFPSGTTSALPLHFKLLPEHLSRLGYRSHLVGKWHLGCHKSEYLPTHRGFDSHFGFWNGYLDYFAGVHEQSPMIGFDARRNEAETWFDSYGQYITETFAEEAADIIRSHNVSEGPMYLQVALSAPHVGNEGQRLQVRDFAENEEQHSYICDVQRRLYAGMVREADKAVGHIVEALKDSNMLQNSVILFTSDNGAPTFDPVFDSNNNSGSNWPLRGMKMSCHEGGVRVAAVLWSPLVAGGRVLDQLVHITDWLPTLYTAAGGDVKDLGEIDGVSQWNVLKHKTSPAKRTEMLVEMNPVNENEAYIHWPWKIIKYNSNHPTIHIHAGASGMGAEVPQYSVDKVLDSPAAKAICLDKTADEILAVRSAATIDKQCPLVVNNLTNVSQCVKHYCLFNLQEDPCETCDVSGDHPDTVRELVKALDSYRHLSTVAISYDVDPRSDPNNHGHYWTTWADL